MLYLFNKVYVKIDANFGQLGERNVLIASPFADQLPSDEFGRAVVEMDIGQIHAAVTSYDKLVDHFGSEDDLFSYLVEFDPTKKLVVYLTEDGYYRLMIKWFKTILVNADRDIAYKVAYATMKRAGIVLGNISNPSVVITPTESAKNRALGARMPSRGNFAADWDATVPFDVSKWGYQYFADRCGIEFQVASYLLNKDTSIALALETKLKMMVNTIYIQYMLEVKELVNTRIHVLMGYDFHTQTIDDWVRANSRYRFLTDPLFTADNIDYVLSSYDLTELSSVWNESMELCGQKVGSGVADILTPFAPLSMDRLFEIELQSVKWRVYLARGKYNVAINTYLVDYVLELKRTDDQDTLRKLTVA